MKKRKHEEGSSVGMKEKLWSWPTFASYDEYAKMMRKNRMMIYLGDVLYIMRDTLDASD